MTEERFIPKCNFQKCQFIAHIKDNENQVVLDINDIVDLLNELAEENRELRQQLQEKQEDEKLYANEILELNKTKKEMLNFRNLGSDY